MNDFIQKDADGACLFIFKKMTHNSASFFLIIILHYSFNHSGLFDKLRRKNHFAAYPEIIHSFFKSGNIYSTVGFTVRYFFL